MSGHSPSPPPPAGGTTVPHAIWALGPLERPEAVIEAIQLCAAEFGDAVGRDSAKDAQDLAMHALASVAGLFPDPNDDAHVLLNSLLGMLLAAKEGRTGHILMRRTKPIPGTKRGLGHAYVGGYAIAAVRVLTERGLLSDRKARTHVASILSAQGFSLRKGEHDVATPMSGSAIRNWRDDPQQYPVQNAIAEEMAKGHKVHLQGAGDLGELLAYLKDQAKVVLEHSRSF